MISLFFSLSLSLSLSHHCIVSTQDGTGSFFLDSDTKIYWVYFLDGLQRILLFTEDLVMAINAQEVTLCLFVGFLVVSTRCSHT